MFITAVCVIFLIKLRWPKHKSLYDTLRYPWSDVIRQQSAFITRSTSLGVAKAGNLKLDFMAKSNGIHLLGFEDILICYRHQNLKNPFGRMDTLNTEPNFVRMKVPELKKDLQCCE